MKVNPGKCHILLSTKNANDVHLEGACITSSSCEKLLGITTDSDLKFDKHISDIFLCDKFCKKINALCRVTGYMSLKKRSENVCRITIQLLPFNMDVTFQNFE